MINNDKFVCLQQIYIVHEVHNLSIFLTISFSPNVWIMKKIYIQPVSEQEVLTPLLLQEFTGSSDDVDVGGSDDSDDDNRIKALEDETEWGTLW